MTPHRYLTLVDQAAAEVRALTPPTPVGTGSARQQPAAPAELEMWDPAELMALG